MGMDSQAHLHYGVVLPEDGPFPWSEEYEHWDEWWYDVVDQEDRNEVEIITTGYPDYPTYMVVIETPLGKGKDFRVEWSEVQRVHPDELMRIRPSHRYAITDFCEKYGIIYVDGPGWFLAASYG